MREHEIRLIVPLADLDHLLLAERRTGSTRALVLLPAPDVVRRTEDKYEAHVFFEEHGIPSPPSWLPDELPDDPAYPVLVKPRRGFGSRHIYRCHDREELDFQLRRTPADSFVQQVCAGEEFSIDVFCDFEGRCLNAIPRTMIESKGGESIKGMTIEGPELIEFGPASPRRLRSGARRTCSASGSRTGRHEVTDVNPRFGGGFPLPLAAGSRYPELALALAEGERPEPRLGDFRAGRRHDPVLLRGVPERRLRAVGRRAARAGARPRPSAPSAAGCGSTAATRERRSRLCRLRSGKGTPRALLRREPGGVLASSRRSSRS